MIGILAVGVGAALASSLGIALVRDPLAPGLPVDIAVGTSDGGPATLSVQGGGLVEVVPGHRWRWTPATARTFELVAAQGTERVTRSVDVLTQAEGRIRLSSTRVEASAGAGGASVAILEGGVADVFGGEGGVTRQGTNELRVRLAPGGGPRLVPFAVRGEGERGALLGVVRVRATVAMPYEVEAGASLRLQIGSRSYGPFDADADGHIAASVEQFPGEVSAEGVFADRLGNETRATLPLPARPTPAVLVVPPADPGDPGLVGAWAPDGSAWRGVPPTCSLGDAPVAVVPAGPGRWWWSLGAEPAPGTVVCTLGDVAAEADWGGQADRPDRVVVRVWPEEIRADFPTAELRVVAEDARGRALEVDGLDVVARFGKVRVESRDAVGGLRALYLGEEAIDEGHDWVEATWNSPPSTEAVAALQAGSDLEEDGRVALWGRAVDRRGRPVAGVGLQMGGVGASETVLTDARGYAVRRMARPVTEVVVWRVAWEGLATEVAVGAATAHVSPDRPDLAASTPIQVRPGAAVAIVLDVEPDRIHDGPSDIARLRIAVRDVAGGRTDEVPTVHASEGEVGEVQGRADGTWTATWAPDHRGRARKAEITASAGGVVASTTVQVEPALQRGALGLWAGGIANLGKVGGPAGGVDVDLRVRRIAPSFVLRTSLGVWGAGAEFDLLPGEPATLDSTLWSGAVQGQLRRDHKGIGVWVGAGAMAALEDARLHLDGELLSRQVGLRGGPLVSAGGAIRVGEAGEVGLEARSTWLLAQPEQGFTGNLGGLALGLAYRVLF